MGYAAKKKNDSQYLKTTKVHFPLIVHVHYRCSKYSVPMRLLAHCETQDTIQNIANDHGNILVGPTQKLSIWLQNDMYHFSKFISQRKSLAETDHMALPNPKDMKYNPNMCLERDKIEMTIWQK